MMSKADSYSTRQSTSLQSEFKAILNRQIDRIKAANNPTDRSSTAFSSTNTDSFTYFESLDNQSNEHLNDLINLIQKLDSAGHIGDCVDAYICTRKFILDEKFRCLGVGKCSIDDVRSMDWELLNPKIKSWNRAASLCFEHLFVKEKILHEQIFRGLRNFVYDEGYIGIIYEFALYLINFAQGLSFSQPSFMKLFEVIDVYESLSKKVLPQLYVVFGSNLYECQSIRDKSYQTDDLLAKFIRKMLQVFESSVLHEKSSISISGSTIRLTKFAMNYVSRLLSHKEVLYKLVVSQPTTKSTEIDDDFVYLEDVEKPPFELHLLWIIISLKHNLKKKSEVYTEAPLRCLFMMNNINYIIQNITDHSELQQIVGREYLNRLSKYVLEAAESYVKLSWGGVLDCVRDDDGLSVSYLCTFCLSKSTLKDRLKNFIAAFDGVCRAQSTWSVPDTELREKLHRLILEELTPAYESLLGQNKRGADNITFSVSDLKDTVCNLFVQC